MSTKSLREFCRHFFVMRPVAYVSNRRKSRIRPVVERTEKDPMSVSMESQERKSRPTCEKSLSGVSVEVYMRGRRLVTVSYSI